MMNMINEQNTGVAENKSAVDVELIPQNPILEDVSFEIVTQLLNESPLDYLEKLINVEYKTCEETLVEVLGKYKKRLKLSDDEYERGYNFVSKSLFEELSFQFDKLELYVRTTLFSFPKKLVEHVRKQNNDSIATFPEKTKNLHKKISYTHNRILAMKALKDTLNTQIDVIKNRLMTAENEKKVVCDILHNQRNSFGTMKDSKPSLLFTNLMEVLQESIYISDNLDYMLKRDTIEILSRNGENEDSIYMKSVLDEVEKGIMNVLNLPTSSNVILDSQHLMKPLNENEICRYSSDYFNFSQNINLDALKCWEDIL